MISVPVMPPLGYMDYRERVAVAPVGNKTGEFRVRLGFYFLSRAGGNREHDVDRIAITRRQCERVDVAREILNDDRMVGNGSLVMDSVEWTNPCTLEYRVRVPSRISARHICELLVEMPLEETRYREDGFWVVERETLLSYHEGPKEPTRPDPGFSSSDTDEPCARP